MDENAMKQIKMLIEYQTKDIALRKLNGMLNSSESKVSMDKNRKAFAEAKRVEAECDEQARELIDRLAELEKYVDENEAVLAEYENAVVDESEEELAERVKKLESIRGKFQNAEKKAHDMNTESGRICHTRNDVHKNGLIAKQQYAEASAKYNALLESKADEKNKLKAELEQMAKTLDKDFFEEYKKLVEEKKFPPIAVARGDDKKGLYNCGGCGLSLPQQGNSLLKDKGWCR